MCVCVCVCVFLGGDHSLMSSNESVWLENPLSLIFKNSFVYFDLLFLLFFVLFLTILLNSFRVKRAGNVS